MVGEWFLTVSNWVPSILTRGWSISYNNFFWTNHDNYGYSDEGCVLLPPLSLRLLCLSTEQWAIGLKEEAPNCQASFLRHKPLKTFWGKNTYWRMKTFILVLFGILALVNAAPQLGKRPPPQKRYLIQNWYVKAPLPRVSAQGVESLWGDCRFIPADILLFLKTFHYKNDKKCKSISIFFLKNNNIFFYFIKFKPPA